MVKNPLANAGDIEYSGLIPGSGRSFRIGNGNPFLAWKIPWTEEPGGLQSKGLQESYLTEHACICYSLQGEKPHGNCEVSL